jgi:hypothetical protein
MKDTPIITSVEVHEFWYETTNLGRDYNGFNSVYEPGAKGRSTTYALRIRTNQGLSGEFVGGGPVEAGEIRMYAHYLIGKDALEREKIYNDVKRPAQVRQDEHGPGGHCPVGPGGQVL